MASASTRAAMRLLAVGGVGPVKVRRLAEHLEKEGASLAEAVAEPDSLRALLSEKQIVELVANAERTAEEIDALLSDDVAVLGWLDATYPSQLLRRLGRNAPPVLTARGNQELLGQGSVGFCGSRKASEKGLAVAKDCADQLATANINVVSGYAAGVDMAAHRAALVGGGTTTIVLAEGVTHFRIKRDVREYWDWERVCVVSEFPSSGKWSVGNAMKRNHTICGFSDAMILIEASSKGGSIAAGRAALSMGVPLYAAEYQGMPDTAQGNRDLLEEGAKALLRSRHTNRAMLDALLSSFENGDDETQPQPSEGQLSMFGR